MKKAMNHLLYSVCLACLMLACHSDVVPTDSLYQRWQLVQYRQGSGGWVADTSTALTDVDYQPNGLLVYRVGGQTNVVCGRANRFARQRDQVTFFVDIECVYVARTEPFNYKATITQLTSDLLELTSAQTVSQFKSVK